MAQVMFAVHMAAAADIADIIKMKIQANDIHIRNATLADADRIVEIYAYYIKNTAITFEYDVPTVEDFQMRMKHVMERYPYLVIEKGGIVQGYTYAGSYIGRAACDWSCEVSIYLAHDAVKCGMGRMLYEAMETALKDMGMVNVYASIAYSDTEDEYLTKNSLQFHEHLGYSKIGEFYNCGYKFGRWYSLVWVGKSIGEYKEDMEPIRLYCNL